MTPSHSLIEKALDSKDSFPRHLLRGWPRNFPKIPALRCGRSVPRALRLGTLAICPTRESKRHYLLCRKVIPELAITSLSNRLKTGGCVSYCHSSTPRHASRVMVSQR